MHSEYFITIQNCNLILQTKITYQIKKKKAINLENTKYETYRIHAV